MGARLKLDEGTQQSRASATKVATALPKQDLEAAQQLLKNGQFAISSLDVTTQTFLFSPFFSFPFLSISSFAKVHFFPKRASQV